MIFFITFLPDDTDIDDDVFSPKVFPVHGTPEIF
jgi:hypothetical protein